MKVYSLAQEWSGSQITLSGKQKFSPVLQVARKYGEIDEPDLRSYYEEHPSCWLRIHTTISILSFAHLYAFHMSSKDHMEGVKHVDCWVFKL